MRRLDFLWLVLCVAMCATTERARGDEPSAPKAVAAPKPTSDEIERWIQDLNAPEFAKREEATRRLIAAGTDAAEPLLKSASSSSLEATCRITTILRTWYTSGKDELIEAAEVAFEQLTESKNRHIAGRAVAVLEQYGNTIRQDRALAQIKQLGGTVEEAMAGARFRAIDDSKAYMVILGRNWRGGEEGLKYLRRVSGLRNLYLLQDQSTGKIVTPGITAESIDELRRALPALAIDYRGPAFLGVKAMANVSICKIDEVPSGTPADKAKLQSGDVVVQFNDQPINSFQDLVKQIGTKQPGDVIKLEVLRGCEENDLLLLERIKELPDADTAKQLLEKLRQRLGKKIDVTLGEWGKK